MQRQAQKHTAKKESLNSQPPLVQIKRLTIKFGQSTVLRELNLSIGTGQTLAIVGESGSGKSLTALSLLQLLPSQADISGSILLENALSDTPGKPPTPTDITFWDAASMAGIRGAQIAMIFQEPMSSLNPVQRCGQQVTEAILTHQHIHRSLAKQRTIRLFEEVQLPAPEKLYDKYPHQISGGQKQRVMIAMAMSCSPRLLICDEPTTALDVMVQKDILKLIGDLQQKNNMSVLFISHDIQLVAAIADQIAVLYKGELVETGHRDQIIDHPQHPYTKALLACRPGLYQHGQRLPVVSDFIPASNSTIQKTTIAKPGQPPALSTQAGVLTTKQASAAHAAHRATENTPILQIKNLQVWYPTQHNFWGKTTGYYKAIRDLDLQVNKAETLGLVGGSGCGKTTLGRAVMGLTAVHAGKILYKGADWLETNRSPRSRAQQMQMIFQDPYSALNPRIPIGPAIAEALLVHGLSNPSSVRDEVCHWLEKVGLQPDHYNRYPHAFSGGQRQRIVIARALILKPDFVILDESVSALDVSVQAQVLNLFNDLKAAMGFTSIFISHDLSVVHYISDRIAVMHEGKIAELGSADDVYHHPKSSYTKALLAAVPSGRLSR